MKIRSLIIDDDPFASSLLQDHIKEQQLEIAIVGVASNGVQGLAQIKTLQPDLIFLDVEMPEMTGFEMLSQLPKITFQTIFTTSFSQYAIQAIRFNALDYLTKPIVASELKAALVRFLSNQHRTTNQRHVEQALQNLQTANPKDQALLLPMQGGEFKVTLKDIIRIEGERNYSYLYLADNRKQLTTKTLSYFESVLLDKGFFRCHKSHIINHHHLLRQTLNDSVIMSNKEEIPISRRKKKEFKFWVIKNTSIF